MFDKPASVSEGKNNKNFYQKFIDNLGGSTLKLFTAAITSKS
jgi:hypothetical protein